MLKCLLKRVNVSVNLGNIWEHVEEIMKYKSYKGMATLRIQKLRFDTKYTKNKRKTMYYKINVNQMIM